MTDPAPHGRRPPAATTTPPRSRAGAPGTPGGRRRRRSPADPARAWARRLARTRPGLVEFTLDALASIHGRPRWERRLDPVSELVLTILSQNTADVNAEKAFESLRAHYPGSGAAVGGGPGEGVPAGWGGKGIDTAPPPDWAAVEAAPLPKLIEAIRPGGLAPQKAPRIQGSLRHVREAVGAYDLEFLAEMPAREARAWLTEIPGIGKKTASVLLLFCFGAPLMPVDRHVERVSHRIGLTSPKATADQAHDEYLELLEPDQMYEAHVNLIRHGRLICHARRPECARCPVLPRCRYPDPKAP